ncbi:MAG TPA: amylo-alpha-1,6-glucosidase [Anaerolineales bacterium]|nr:amylo-alpha-1,6-glucosidase [Anaerolineales bacterium]
MKKLPGQEVEKAKQAALEVLLHNMHGSYEGLPRTAGWGYPEPYTRDLMISLLGIVVSENQLLMKSIEKVLKILAKNQTEHGHIPSLVHEKDDVGASDTTPLFLLALGIFRRVSGESHFLENAAQKALTWMAYQSPTDRYIVSQQPTSDWRDEQWVMGYGLYVNTLVYSYLRLFEQHKQANQLRDAMTHFTITGDLIHRHVHEGLVVPNKPYYALWSYKVYSSERFDLLGNSLAILSGIALQSRADAIIDWVEAECVSMKQKGELALDLPPNFFPFIRPSDPDWHPRYEKFNLPGDYHNGGIWPFIAGFYVAALVAAKRYELANEKLLELTKVITKSNSLLNPNLEYGFNEWLKAQNGAPMGQNWQTWSAALYLYAAKCVEERRTPFFDEIRSSAAQ